MKKLISFFLSVIMVFSLCVNTFAYTEPKRKAVIYDYKDYFAYVEVKPNKNLEFSKEAKNCIINALKQVKDSVNIEHLNLSVDEVKQLYPEIVNENPELFYAHCGITIYFYDETRAAEIVFQYDYDKERINYMKKEFDTAFKKAVKQCFSDDMTDFEKMLSAHDYIVLNTKYDVDTYNGIQNPDSFNAYGTLVNKKAVCAGYAALYNALLKYAGIETKFVASDAMNHAWNLVKLQGKWYHVDATWDDPGFPKTDDEDMEGFVGHQFFLLSDNVISDSEHNHNGWSTDVPSAIDDSYINSFFKDITTGMFYYDGRWYYGTDYFYGGDLISNVFDGSDPKAVDIGNLKAYAIARKGNVLYFSASKKDVIGADKIYKYDLKKKTLELVADFNGRFEITELSIQDTILRYVKYDGSNYVVENMDISRRIDSMYDIDVDHWAYDAIDFCMDRYILNGKDNNMFDLNENMTRAQFCQMIYNYLFSYEIADPKYDVFDDVSKDDWFYTAVNVCYKHGIIKGTGDGFEPNGSIKREDVSLIMMRLTYSEEEIESFNTEEKLLNLKNQNIIFNDLDSISGYAYNAMIASLGTVFNGDENGNINPKDLITRAQCAQVMYNYINNEP